MTKTFSWREAPKADFAVIAEDAGHSLSPLMHNTAFRQVGFDSEYVALNVPVGEVGEALDRLAQLGYKGANVTLPHKAEARAWVRRFESEYEKVQVANTIRFDDRFGFNTDTIGFAESIAKYNLAKNDRVLLLGAGGSALAVLAVLAKTVGQVDVWNRTPKRALDLIAKFPEVARSAKTPNPARCRMIVNATSAGKYGEQPPVEWSAINQHCSAYDLFYAPGSTPFLRSAAARGLFVQDGVELLVLQGAASWGCWRIDPKPPINQMEKTVREALTMHA